MNIDEFQHEYDLNSLKTITPSHRDFQMLVTPRFVQRYGDDIYEGFTSDVLINICHDNTLFIDIGAHYGFYSLLLGTRFPKAKIVSFEPVPMNYEILKRNIELNHLTNVTANNIAISDRHDVSKFVIANASDSCGFTKHPLTKTLDTIEVKTDYLDDIYKSFHKTPIIVKIDTEGHEIHVLDGMKELIRNSDDIKLIVEFNPKCLKQEGHTPDELLEKIIGLGFEIYFLHDEERVIFKLNQDNIKNWLDYIPDQNEIRYSNLLCIQKPKSFSVLWFSHSSQLAGAERSLLELTRQLVSEHGMVCTVVLPSEGPLKQELEDIGASTLIIKSNWWCDTVLPSQEEITRRLNSSLFALIENLELLERINPDIIITNTLVIPWGALAAGLLKKPHAWFVREFGEMDCKFRFYLPFHDIVGIISSSNLVIANSVAVKDSLSVNSQFENIELIYPPVDVKWAQETQDEGECFRRPNATRLIVFGTIAEHKGQKDAVLAVKELVRNSRDVELVVMGPADPAYLEQLEEIVNSEELTGHVNFVGFKNNPYSVVQKADIVLVCSRNEAFGRINLEAMLLKKPVIATNRGGVPELIKEGYNGLLFEPGDIDALVQNIEYFIQNPQKIQEFGENGYVFAQKNFAREMAGQKLAGHLTRLKGSIPKTSVILDHFVAQNSLVALSELQKQSRFNSGIIKDLEGSLLAKDSQIKDLESELTIRSLRISELETGIGQISQQVSSMQLQPGITLNLLRRYQGFVDKLLPLSTGRRRNYELGLSASRIILNEGWRSFWSQYQQYKRGKRPLKIKLRRMKPLPEIKDNSPDVINKKVTIVIPTKNAGLDFDYTLEKINNQKGLREIETIVVDSGSIDQTIEISKNRGATVFTIQSGSFNHGLTRNYGAEQSSGDYYLFMVQDAIPIGDYWLYNMVSVLEKNEKIGAATCRQVPRSDAELFACFSLWNHYRMLEFSEDTVAWPDIHFSQMSPLQKRKMAGMEDVCGLVRSGVFNKLKFRPVPYAEDLELGIRILKSGHGIAYLYSSGIIHSHNRSPVYSMKRHYVDGKSLPDILGYKPIMAGESNVSILFSDIVTLYLALRKSIQDLSISSKKPADVVSDLKTLLLKNLVVSSPDLLSFSPPLDDLGKLLHLLLPILGPVENKNSNAIVDQYFYVLDEFELYLQGFLSLKDKRDEFVSALYHHLAVLAGSTLAQFYVCNKDHGNMREKLSAMDKILSEGV